MAVSYRFYQAEKIPLTSGMRVMVLYHKAYKTMSLAGLVGTVKSSYCGNNIAVKLDDLRNDNSSYGYFYFSRNELTIVNETENENNNMEENTMSKITNYLNGVKIKFAGDATPSRYVYANFDPSLAVNDTCVVKTPNNPMEVATVVEILDGNDYETDREIVAKVDMTDYNFRVETRVKAAELKAKMQERAKKLQDIALYQMLAKDDSEMLDLLNQYQSLPSV